MSDSAYNSIRLFPLQTVLPGCEGKGRDTVQKIPSNRELLWLSKGQKKQRSLMLGTQLTPQKLLNSALPSGSKKNPTPSHTPKKCISKIKKSLSRNYLISPTCNNIKFTCEQSGHNSMLSLNYIYKMKVPADKLPM